MCGPLWQGYQNWPRPGWLTRISKLLGYFLQFIRSIGTESMRDYWLTTQIGIGAIEIRKCAIPYFSTEKKRDWPARWLRLTLTNQTTNITGNSIWDATYFPAHLAKRPSVLMACTIAKNLRRSRQGSLYKTKDEEGDQRQVPDEEINLSDDREDENKGRVTSVVMSANTGACGGGGL